MYQIIKQTKITQPQYQKRTINSVRLIDFNQQWAHPYQAQFLKGKTRKNDFQVNKSEQRHEKQCKTLKLPQIKKQSRQNGIIQRVNFQKLKQIDIAQRIKNLKQPSDNQENANLISQSSLKHKVQEIRKLNSNLRKTRNAHEKQSGTISTVPLKAKMSITSKANIEQQCQKLTQKQAKNEVEQEQKQQKIQIYDKKMKIGRKKKKEEDRIRAMLLKTLQKTKGTDYIAQQGSSQTKKSPRTSRITNTQRSRSKDSPEQQTNLILINPKTTLPNLKRPSIRINEVQKLKSSLLPIKSSRFPQQQQPSNYVKNKKFVQMVREVQNRKKFFQQQLHEIKEQRTISHQDENNQQENVKKQVDNNEFLPQIQQ